MEEGNNKIEKRKRNANSLGMTLEEYEEWCRTKQKPKNVLLKERIQHLEFIQNNLLSGLDIKNKNIIELKKKISSSNLKIIELEKYIKETSEGQIRILQKEIEKKEIENNRKTDALKKEVGLTEKIKDLFKDFLIKEFFPGKDTLKNRPLQWLIDLYYERKSTAEKPKHDTLSNQKYLKSELCICGKFKKFGSKGCSTCKKEAEKYNKRDGVGMEKAWEKVWKRSGISME